MSQKGPLRDATKNDAVLQLVYLLFVDLQSLFDVGDLWRPNGQSLDVSRSKGTQVAHRFNLSGANEEPEASRPAR